MPAKMYSELQDRMAYKIGKVSGRTALSTHELVIVKDVLNQAREAIYDYAYWPWAKRRGYIVTTARYNTGTIDLTQYDETVSGTDTVITAAMEGRYLIHSSTGYKLRKRTSDTEFELEVPYKDDDAEGESYSICQPEYTLPYYVREIVKDSMKVIGEGDSLTFMTEPEFNDQYPNPSDIESVPTKYRLPDYSDNAYYSTGTIAISAASGTVTGVDTVWDNQMIGRAFRVSGESEIFEVDDVASVGSLTLKRAHLAAVDEGTSYEIDPAPCLKIWLYPFLTQKRGIEFWYWTKPDPLINDTDIDLRMPGDMHEGILFGAEWLWTKQEETDPQGEQTAKGVFDEWLFKAKKKQRITQDKSVGLRPHSSYA